MSLHPLLLESLPVEIQCSIVRLLDPIDLISLSQTSTRFRRLIAPRRSHFVERLLALECLEKEGGPHVTFLRDGGLEPDRSSKEWEAMRWACTQCLRLRPHTTFNIYSLLRLAYRKPIPGSAAASSCTSWEPAINGSGHRQRRRQLRDSSEEQQLRRRYGLAVASNLGRRRDALGLIERWTEYQNCNMAGFQAMSLSEFERLTKEQEQAVLDREARAVELERSGFKRHLRRCIECQYQRNQLRPDRNESRGTVNVPIVVSCQLSFGTVVDRYFPAFSDVLENKRPPFNAPVFVIRRRDAYDRLWTMYRIRCPKCLCWQEMRAFRFGGLYTRWEPIVSNPNDHDRYCNWDNTTVTSSLIDSLRCNSCFLEEHGRQELGKSILEWLNHLIDTEMYNQECRLVSGWNTLFHRLKQAPKEFKAEIKALLRDTRSICQKDHAALSRSDVALLRLRHTQWMDLWEQMQIAGKIGWFPEDRWFHSWMYSYNESEALWTWLKVCKEEIKEKVEVLINWVITRDSSAA